MLNVIEKLINKLLLNLKAFSNKVLIVPTAAVVNIVKKDEIKIKKKLMDMLYIYSNSVYLNKFESILKYFVNVVIIKVKKIVNKIDAWKDACDKLADFYDAENLQKRLKFYKAVKDSFKKFINKILNRKIVQSDITNKEPLKTVPIVTTELLKNKPKKNDFKDKSKNKKKKK